MCAIECAYSGARGSRAMNGLLAPAPETAIRLIVFGVVFAMMAIGDVDTHLGFEASIDQPSISFTAPLAVTPRRISSSAPARVPCVVENPHVRYHEVVRRTPPP